MLYREIIALCSEIYTKHINTLYGQNIELLNVKPPGTYSDHWDLREFFCLSVTVVALQMASAWFSESSIVDSSLKYLEIVFDF